jgi:hypothetical protein
LEARYEGTFSLGGVTDERLFIDEMNCPSERDQIRNWFGSLALLVQFFLGGELAKHRTCIFFPVCFPGHLD